MPWKALTFDHYLEDGLDSLGLEKNRFETGIKDPDSLNGTENLAALYDYDDDHPPPLHDHPQRPRRRAAYRPPHKRPKHAKPLSQGDLTDRCPGSNQEVNGEPHPGSSEGTVVCSACSQWVVVYPRKNGGLYKPAHLLPIVSEGTNTPAPSKTS